MIKLQVIGNLGKDCIVTNVKGKNVIKFSVAHNEKYKDNTGSQREKTIWVECAYWVERTLISSYLKKGIQVYVEGIPEVRAYSSQDGKPGASLSLLVSNIQLLGSRNQDPISTSPIKSEPVVLSAEKETEAVVSGVETMSMTVGDAIKTEFEQGISSSSGPEDLQF